MKNKKIVFSLEQLDIFKNSDSKEIEEIFYKCIGIKLEHLGIYVFSILFMPVYTITTSSLGDMNIFLETIIIGTVFVIIHTLFIVILFNTFIKSKLEKEMNKNNDDF